MNTVKMAPVRHTPFDGLRMLGSFGPTNAGGFVDSVGRQRRSALRAVLRERFDANMSALARAIERSPTSVWRLVGKSGGHEKAIGERLARDIEKKLGMPAYELDRVIIATENPPPSVVHILQGESTAQKEVLLPVPAPQGPRTIPCLQDQDIGQWLNGVSGEFNRVGFVYSEALLGPRAFALIASGVAMAPEISEGDRVFIDPDVEPLAGDVVLAQVSDAIVLRRLRPKTGAIFELAATNNDFAPVSSTDGGVSVLGVLVEHHKYRRQR